MTSEGLGEMFEGDSADTCAGKFPLGSMGGRAEGLAYANPGARTPIGTSGNLYHLSGSIYFLDMLLISLENRIQCVLNECIRFSKIQIYPGY